MVVIRLARVGKKKQPQYRIVVADKRRAATGRFMDIIGHYNPLPDPAHVQIDTEKFMEWLSKGAQPSDTVRRLYDRAQKGEEIKNSPKNRKKDKAVAAATPVAETNEAEAGTAEPATEEELVSEPATEEEVASEPADEEEMVSSESDEATSDASQSDEATEEG
jgi:small subunit ribosomal protein S16